MEHFLILLVIVEWNDRNTIVNVESEAVCAVVYDYDVGEGPVFEYSKVFDVVAVFCLYAVLPVQAVLK